LASHAIDPDDFSSIILQEFEFLERLHYIVDVLGSRSVKYRSAMLELHLFEYGENMEWDFYLRSRPKPRIPDNLIALDAIFHRDAWEGNYEIDLYPSNRHAMRAVMRCFAERLEACHTPLLLGDPESFAVVNFNFNHPLRNYGPFYDPNFMKTRWRTREFMIAASATTM